MKSNKNTPKQIIVLILLLFVSSVQLFFYKSYNKTPNTININENSISELSIAKLPVPPKKKVLSQKKDIKKIVQFVNSIKLTKKLDEPFKGWTYLINIKGKDNSYTISFLGDKINVNNTWYEIDSDVINTLDSIYKHLDYKKEDFFNK